VRWPLGGPIVRTSGQVSINQHHRGQLYNHVVKKKLAEAAGYKSAW
jgi:hypothetical protein